MSGLNHLNVELPLEGVFVDIAMDLLHTKDIDFASVGKPAKIFVSHLEYFQIISILATTQNYLKCDARGCIHYEFHDEINQSLVGKPCPKCGSSILTQEDFDKGPQSG